MVPWRHCLPFFYTYISLRRTYLKNYLGSCYALPVFFTFCHWKYFWNRCWMSKFTWQSSFFSLAVRLSCCRLNHIPYVCFKHLRVLPCVNLVIRWFHANWDNLEGHCEEMTSDLDRVSAIEYLTSTIGKEMAFQKSSKIKVLIYRLVSVIP